MPYVLFVNNSDFGPRYEERDGTVAPVVDLKPRLKELVEELHVCFVPNKTNSGSGTKDKPCIVDRTAVSVPVVVNDYFFNA